MENQRLVAGGRAERIMAALLFVLMGTAMIVVFSPWRPMIKNDIADYLGRIGMILLLLAITWLVRRSQQYHQYWQVSFGLLVMAAAISLDRIISLYLVDSLKISDAAPSGWAILKLNECAVVAAVVVLLTHLSGGNLGSLYLQKGNLKLGLSVGLAAFVFFAATAIPVSTLLFNAQTITFAQALPWLPWLLVFVLANAALEELLFRGLFLQKLEPFFGKFLSVFLIAFVFTLLHNGVSYTSQQLMFLAILFPLALFLGYFTQKTGSLWGSILIHAGMDIPVMIGIFSNLP